MPAEPGRPALGVFGGTFDPIHLGHLVAAQDVIEALGLARLLLVPASRSPHKADGPLAPSSARLRMARSAVEGDTRFEVSELELRRGGTSYTVDTLEALREAAPDTRLVLVLGTDQWASFARWHRPRDIAGLAELAVMARDGEHPQDVDPGFDDDAPSPTIREVPITRVDLSASAVRRRVREGRSVRYLVPDPVRRIIEAEKLYVVG